MLFQGRFLLAFSSSIEDTFTAQFDFWTEIFGAKKNVHEIAQNFFTTKSSIANGNQKVKTRELFIYFSLLISRVLKLTNLNESFFVPSNYKPPPHIISDKGDMNIERKWQISEQYISENTF